MQITTKTAKSVVKMPIFCKQNITTYNNTITIHLYARCSIQSH